MNLSLITATILVIGIAVAANAEVAADEFIQIGAEKARDCVKISQAVGPYKSDRMQAYAKCLNSMTAPIEHSSEKENMMNVGIFVAGGYILKRDFGSISQAKYGALGYLRYKEVDSGYNWALSYLKGRGLEKEAVCAVVDWVDCKMMP